MIRDSLRIIGAACILAGGILYFTTDSESPINAETVQLQGKVKKLQSELSKTKEALGIAQTASMLKESATETTDEKADKKDNNLTESNAPITTTILTIEPGSNSTVASASLERLGIIESAALFDTFLNDNGLTGKIQIGEHKVDSSMNFQTIARVITTVK